MISFLSVASDLPQAKLDKSNLSAYLPSHVVYPIIKHKDLQDLLRRLNLQKATISCDLPVRILREFAYELCFPLAHILKCAYSQSVFPQVWKFAKILPMPKSHPPRLSELLPMN